MAPKQAPGGRPHSGEGSVTHRRQPLKSQKSQYFIEDIKSRELSHQELSEIFDETSNGVAALQASLIQKIKHGPGINVVDIIPQSVSYFERFCGPVPGTQEPESYFAEVLVPHRKALLNRNLETGLDICCLGALRDDLTPGQWVTSIDDDAIWNALSSTHAESNPFSLLGALDIALYRQGDRRFREFSAEAVAKLLDERLGQQNGTDVYRLLNQDFHFGPGTVKVYTRAAPHTTSFRAEPCT